MKKVRVFRAWFSQRLDGLTIGPGDLLKIAIHSKTKLFPSVPPAPIPIRDEGEVTADEAASDPPSPKEVEAENVKVDENKNDPGAEGDVEIEGMSELLAHEAADNQALKGQMEEYTRA